MKAINSILTCLACMAFTIQLTAQDNPQVWYVVDYMKVKPGMYDKYLECEQAWKSIHTERKKRGIITNWELFQVDFPAGSNTEYDYVTVTTINGGWKGYGKLYSDWSDDYTKVVPKDKLPVVQNTESYRTLVKTEVLSLQDFVYNKDNKPFKYCFVNYFDVPDGRWEEYYDMETKLVKPVHQMDIDNGKRLGWLLNAVAIPSANDSHDAITVDLYENWDSVGSGTEGAWKKIHPNMSDAYIDRQIESSRKFIKREMWELINSL